MSLVATTDALLTFTYNDRIPQGKLNITLSTRNWLSDLRSGLPGTSLMLTVSRARGVQNEHVIFGQKSRIHQSLVLMSLRLLAQVSSFIYIIDSPHIA